MIGAIVGDVCGSVYERRKYTGGTWDILLFTPESHFTDDTVMTLAVAEALREGWGDPEKTRTCLVRQFHRYGEKYPNAGYGQSFRRWLKEDQSEPYGSFGNGSAMRVSPVGWAFDTIEETRKYAEISASVTHNHPEGIKGACSVAEAIFMARHGESRDAIRKQIEDQYGYDLSRTLKEIRDAGYKWSSRCQTSVPEAIICFLDGGSFEQSIKNAIWLGGDADTQAAIAGAIAEAYYKDVPTWMATGAQERLDDFLLEKLAEFNTWLERKIK